MSGGRMARTKSKEPTPKETNYDNVVRAKEIRNKRMAEGKVIITVRTCRGSLTARDGSNIS